jgi:hypothetical protein
MLAIGLVALALVVLNQLTAPRIDPPLERAAVLASLLAVVFLLALLWGFEGASLRRLALRFSRHDEVGLVVATAEDEAERRFFADDVKAETIPAKATPAGFVPHGTDNPVMGLFPQARGSA